MMNFLLTEYRDFILFYESRAGKVSLKRWSAAADSVKLAAPRHITILAAAAIFPGKKWLVILLLYKNLDTKRDRLRHKYAKGRKEGGSKRNRRQGLKGERQARGMSQCSSTWFTCVRIENVVKYVWSIQSVNPAVQNVGPVGWCWLIIDHMHS